MPYKGRGFFLKCFRAYPGLSPIQKIPHFQILLKLGTCSSLKGEWSSFTAQDFKCLKDHIACFIIIFK